MRELRPLFHMLAFAAGIVLAVTVKRMHLACEDVLTHLNLRTAAEIVDGYTNEFFNRGTEDEIACMLADMDVVISGVILTGSDIGDYCAKKDRIIARWEDWVSNKTTGEQQCHE